MKQIFIPVFPGTNCEKETVSWITQNLDSEVCTVPQAIQKEKLAAVIVPGGFTFGDYLRAGALAAQSKTLDCIQDLRKKNIPILGICNGFQILCEAKVLPGALTKNTCKHHLHGPVSLRLSESMKAILSQTKAFSVWLPHLSEARLKNFFHEAQFPISCGMGAYLLPSKMRAQLNISLVQPESILSRFSQPDQTIDPAHSNSPNAPLSGRSLQNEGALFESCVAHDFVPFLHYINNEPGSSAAIAAVVSTDGLVLGMMPHPERASDALLGNDTGLIFLLGLSRSQNILVRPKSPLAAFAKKLTGETMHELN